jgi:hypothetical protein
MLNAWLSLSFQAVRLGWDAQNVMALRFIRLADGGASSQSEAYLMVTEKVAALAEATAVAIKGGKGNEVAKMVLNVYQKRVRRNKHRLSR